MTAMGPARRFTLEILRMLSGPIVWGAHFLFVYVFSALAVARQFHGVSWLGAGLVSWAVGLATVLAVAAIVALVFPAWRRVRERPGHGTAAFLSWMTVAFGGLALLAVLWVALPVLLIPVGGLNGSAR
ncbi:hypothetical protein [Methylomagnum sp.]